MTTAPARPPAELRPQTQRSRPGGAAQVQIDPIRVLRQHVWGTVAASIIGVAVGGVAYGALSFVYPLFSAQVLFELPAPPSDVGDVIVRDQRTEEAVERLGQTEASRVRSRTLLVAAMNRPDIATTAWSNGYLDESGVFDPEEAVDDLEDELSASHLRRTNFFAISWSTHVASDVPVVLNAIADTYIDQRKAEEDARFAVNRKTFQDQLNRIENEITDLGNQLSKFVQDNNMTSTSEERNELLLRIEDTARQINQTRTQLTLALSRRQQTEQKMKGVVKETPEDIRRAEEDEQMRQANLTLQQLRVEAESLRKRFTEGHAAIRTVEAQVKAAEIERDAKLTEILRRNMNADFKEYNDVAQSQTSVLKEFEDKLEVQTKALKDYTANLTTLQQVRERRERLQEARAKQLEVLANLDQLKAREDARAAAIARRAQTPRELSFPQAKIMLPLGLLLGVGAFLGFVFLREFLDTRVRSAADLSAVQGLRVLGSIPERTDDPTAPARVERAVSEAPRSVIAESCRQISGQISKTCVQSGHKVLGFLSGLPQAGTTSFVSNVADSLAASGKKVLVIDANFRRSHLASAMGIDPDAKGLGDALGGHATFAEIVRQAGGVDVIAAGTPSERVFERLSSGAIDPLLAEAAQRYDFVLIDLPPAVVAGDAITIANKVDATVLVVRAMQEQRGLVLRIANQLSDVRGRCLGVVLNRPQGTSGGYLRKNYEVMAGYSKPS